MNGSRSLGHSTSVDDHPLAQAPAIPGRVWSTMLDGWATRNAPIPPSGELTERMLAAAFSWKEGVASEVPIWTPKGEFRDVRSGLSWGFTVLENNGTLIAFQLVVFVRERAEHAGFDENGRFSMVDARHVSAWAGPAINGMAS